MAKDKQILLKKDPFLCITDVRSHRCMKEPRCVGASLNGWKRECVEMARCACVGDQTRGQMVKGFSDPTKESGFEAPLKEDHCRSM